MKFRFDVNLSERDYVDYNLFHLTKSPYGKSSFSLEGYYRRFNGSFDGQVPY